MDITSTAKVDAKIKGRPIVLILALFALVSSVIYYIANSIFSFENISSFYERMYIYALKNPERLFDWLFDDGAISYFLFYSYDLSFPFIIIILSVLLIVYAGTMCKKPTGFKLVAFVFGGAAIFEVSEIIDHLVGLIYSFYSYNRFWDVLFDLFDTYMNHTLTTTFTLLSFAYSCFLFILYLFSFILALKGSNAKVIYVLTSIFTVIPIFFSFLGSSIVFIESIDLDNILTLRWILFFFFDFGTFCLWLSVMIASICRKKIVNTPITYPAFSPETSIESSPVNNFTQTAAPSYERINHEPSPSQQSIPHSNSTHIAGQTLQGLKELLDAGLITQEEYKEKRAEIIRNL